MSTNFASVARTLYISRSLKSDPGAPSVATSWGTHGDTYRGQGRGKRTARVLVSLRDGLLRLVLRLFSTGYVPIPTTVVAVFPTAKPHPQNCGAASGSRAFAAGRSACTGPSNFAAPVPPPSYSDEHLCSCRRGSILPTKNRGFVRYRGVLTRRRRHAIGRFRFTTTSWELDITTTSAVPALPV